jgi:hypothetical protein
MKKDGRARSVRNIDMITKRILNEIEVETTLKEEQHVERTE